MATNSNGRPKPNCHTKPLLKSLCEYGVLYPTDTPPPPPPPPQSCIISAHDTDKVVWKLGEGKRLTTEGRQGQAMGKTTTHPFHLHDLEVGLLDLVDLVQQLLLPLVPVVLFLITTTQNTSIRDSILWNHNNSDCQISGTHFTSDSVWLLYLEWQPLCLSATVL